MSEVHPLKDVFVFKYAFLCSQTIDKCLLMSSGTTVGRVIFYTLLKSKVYRILKDHK